jgi:hypothetical protein
MLFDFSVVIFVEADDTSAGRENNGIEKENLHVYDLAYLFRIAPNPS